MISQEFIESKPAKRRVGDEIEEESVGHPRHMRIRIKVRRRHELRVAGQRVKKMLVEKNHLPRIADVADNRLKPGQQDKTKKYGGADAPGDQPENQRSAIDRVHLAAEQLALRQRHERSML